MYQKLLEKEIQLVRQKAEKLSIEVQNSRDFIKSHFSKLRREIEHEIAYRAELNRIELFSQSDKYELLSLDEFDKNFDRVKAMECVKQANNMINGFEKEAVDIKDVSLIIRMLQHCKRVIRDLEREQLKLESIKFGYDLVEFKPRKHDTINLIGCIYRNSNQISSNAKKTAIKETTSNRPINLVSSSDLAFVNFMSSSYTKNPDVIQNLEWITS